MPAPRRRGKPSNTSLRNVSHRVEAEQRFEARSAEPFDRVAYALVLLDALKPAFTVAVYPSNRHLRVERHAGIVQNRWALVGVPPHATRENIAHTLVELSGLGKVPFVVDLLSRTAP